ncbi:hypothetical protein LOTGIDRAFT_133235 [Lottia gigantea]|uniref:Protein max n=1 Tax=Lottia gigantea TaxID=225164 RepID=V4B4Z8_LOTGI|nr:hypothetical protein LOTGIDRAFT_133235 [Lottia gigantea]ESO83519.1 hypothetical protein LOTGIDRAFT_133235 [Lottia gigantea]
MSDEDREVDVESDEDFDDVDSVSGISQSGSNSASSSQFASQTEKRAHHNALERKRRDHIKGSFHSLRDSVPSLQGEKVSRAQVLKKASDYIQFMRKKNQGNQQDIEDLKKQNCILEKQIRALEKAKNTGQYAQTSTNGETVSFDGISEETDTSSSESIDINGSHRKKLKLSAS